METKELTCQNCEKPHEEGFEFCPHCGQKTNEDLTIGVLFYNTISNYFSFDARFLKSFIPLMFRPGYLARKFLEGKRLLFLHPAQMYLFISVIFFFIFSFSAREFREKAQEINKKVVESEFVTVNKDSIDLSRKKQDSIRAKALMQSLKDNQKILGISDEDFKKSDSIINESFKSNQPKLTWDFNKKKVDSLIAVGASDEVIYKEMGMSDDAGYLQRNLFKNMLGIVKGTGAGNLVQTFIDTIPISMFLLLPLFALILKLFYFKRGTYAHHLVFSFYFFSYLFTVFSIIFAVNRFVYDIPDWIDWLIVFSTYIYFYVALLNFYKRNWFFTFIKSGVITFVFIMFMLPITFSLLVGFALVS